MTVPILILRNHDNSVWVSPSLRNNKQAEIEACMRNEYINAADIAALRYIIDNNLPEIIIVHDPLKLIADWKSKKVTVALHQPLRSATATAIKRLTEVINDIKSSREKNISSYYDNSHELVVNDPMDVYRERAKIELVRIGFSIENPSLVETVAISLATTGLLPAELLKR
jgi:hypothetical protein